MSAKDSKSPAPAAAAEQTAGAPKDGAPAATASRETSPANDASEVDQKTAADASAEPSENLAEAVAEKTNEATAATSDVEMTDAANADKPPAAAEAPAAADAAATGPTPSKSHAKRKSVGLADPKGKKLNKKASKARILHIDAQPGEHFFVKLKGFPQWPVIICDEDMLPTSLIKSRPVTAKRADGTYRDDYQDGAKKASDRTFPVMYLHTNEFGWVPNSDLIDLDPDTVIEGKSDKMRKDLQAAYDLAAEHNDLRFYKEVLQRYQEEQLEKERQRAAKAATPKSKKAKVVTDDDEDVEMADAADEDDSTPPPKKSAKKRKAEDSVEPPQRAESVKKTKIKLTTNANRKSLTAAESTPKAAKPVAAETKAAKPKTKKKEEKSESEPVVPKEPELTQEEKHARKEKEVLFLRHKLQKGLLTRDQEPKEEEMKAMSDFVSTLESFSDLAVSIIRATKINKVLKAILKLDNIPKEDQFQFKARSQALLDKWNKLLAVEGAVPAATAAPAAAPETNGVNGAKTNGVKAKSEESEKDKPAEEAGEKVASDEKTAEPVEASA
ncbi:hypothetical protein B0T18DRAFT_32121 [Schizothecium vesticola]|uniref:PWWP domain-containing protein n=1 Tax=Schizothecium vesticola TaxID=314040 RepID=A0AA40FAR3_9PEZI|nr:hypothetical protein B0T18DRAFT_32121 [Schizothecium vesticola]